MSVIHKVRDADGVVHKVRGPADASPNAIMAIVQQKLRDQEESVLQRDLDEKRDATINALYDQQDEEDAGFLENIAKGFGAGVVDVGETASLGIAALLEEESERSVRDKIKAAAGAVRPEGGDEDSILYNLSRALGSIAGIAVPAATAAVAAPASLATAAATGVAGLLGVSAAAGEGSERARAAGATEAERSAATLKAAPIGILEILPITRFVKAVDVPVVSKILEKIGPEKVETIGERVNNALTTGGLEGAQEATANVLQNLVESGYNEEVSLLAGTAENAGYGAGAGAITQLFVDALRGRRGRAATTEPTTEEPDTQGELFGDENLGRAPAEQVIRNNPSILDLTNTEFDEYNPGLPEGRDYKDLGIPNEDTYFEIAKIRNQPTAQRELFAGDLGRAPERAGDPDQLDLFAPRAPQPEAVQPDMIEEAESAQLREIIDTEETAQIQALLDEDARAQETRAASDVETIAGQLDTQQQQTTEQRRTAVLQDVIENTPTKQESTLTKNFSNALKAEGITNTQPNELETRTIKRAIDVQRAERPVPVEEPETKPKQFQVRDGQRLPRTEVPFVPERLTAAQTRSVTKKDMDDLNIKPAAPIRKRIEGKDVTTPEVQKELKAYANLPAAPAEAKEKINEQLDLFGSTESIQQGEQTPIRPTDDTRTDRVSFTPARQPRVGSADTTRTDAPARQRLGDTGANLADTARRTAGRTTPLEPITPTAIPTVAPVAERVTPKAAPKKRRPIDQIMEAARARGMTVTPAQARELQTKDLTDEQLEAQVFEERDTQEATQLQEDLESVTTKKKPVAKKAAKKAVPKKVSAEKKEEIKKEVRNKIKKDADKAVAAVPEKTREKSRQLEFYTKKFDEGYKVDFVNKEGDPVVESLDINTTAADDTKILELIKTEIPEQQSKKKNTETQERKEARAAKLYFENQENPNNAIEVITHEATFPAKQFRATKDMSDGERAYFAGKGSETAKMALRWIGKNLSESTNKSVTNLMSYQAESLRSANRRAESLKIEKNDPVNIAREIQADIDFDTALGAQQDLKDKNATFKNNSADAQATLDDLNDFLPDYLRENSVVGLDIPTHPTIGNLLRQGKLVEALRALQTTSPSERVAQLAGALSKVVGDTKVEVKQSVVDDAGNAVAGKFDPTTNTITLNAETGINPHTILHEMTHAATSATLANKSHPLTKQLTKLFNDVKDSLDTAYGSQNVDEFVAEAFSNPEFQQKLGQINVKGEPVSALQRFFNSVANVLRRIMGMQTKNVGSALNQADQLIEAMLAPAPQSRDAGKLYMQAITPNKAATLIDNMVKRVPKWNPKVDVKRVTKVLEDRFPDKAKNFMLGLLPINALVDIAKARIPMASKLEKLTFEASGKITEMNNMIEPVIKRVSAWGSKNQNKLDAFNRVIYTSTLEQVDPSKPSSAYTGEKLKQWKAMQKDWNSLGEEGKNHYKSMRNTYKELYDRMGVILKNKIDEGISDEPTRKKVFKEVYNALYDNGVIEPYFPLTRSGSYWLSYDAIDPRTGNREFYVEAFETKSDRTEAQRVMDADPNADAKNFDSFSNLSEVGYDKAPPTSFVNDVLEVMETNNVDKEVKEQVMRLFLDSLPERSFAQSFRNRKGTLGFERDAIGALRKRTSSLSRQLVQMEYGQKISAVQKEIKDHVREVEKNNDVAVLLANELNQRADWAKNPNVENWAQALTTGGFVMTLGANISSAVVNFSQLPMVVMPYLGGKYGYSETMKATGRAMRMFTNSGFKHTTETIGPDGKIKETTSATPSLDNYDFDSPNTPKEVKEFKILAEVAARRGQLNRSITYDLLDMDRIDSPMRKIGAVSGWIFHHGERLNRQVALMTAYDLELGAMRKAGKTINDAARTEAAEKAIYVTELTNGGAIATGAPRYAQKGIGKVMFLFKRFGISMTYHLAKLTKEAIKGSPTDKLVARKQLAGTVAMAGIIGGAQGLPLVGAIGSVIDLMFGDEDEDNFDTSMRKFLGEGFYGGLGNYLLGVDVASRMGLSNLIFRDQLVQKDQSLFYDAIEMVGGPVVGTALNMERGVGLIAEGNMARGIETMSPAAIRNVLKSYRFGTEGANTLRGDPIIGDVGAGHVFGQLLGFAPAEYTKQLQENASLKRKERAAGTEKSKLYKKYYIAARNGDTAEMKSILKEMEKYNKKFPTTAITLKSFNQSMKAHQRTTSNMHHGIVINPRMQNELMEDSAEYDDTITLWQDLGLTD